ncbi:phasin family protein [Parvicella tangerina]|uniref:Polyhydroxyalkanoate synthesis regulator n=1 Tax=Parvicella tangerina TaxID=2829795 RepID=A0A916JRE8_9FLAO|nr:hypothetical protein [Parvicella tangerina]CAG5087316.1 hypothetical protein CRYO30217_03451 [Parvicella tangerina]
MEQENKELLKKIAYLAIGIFSPDSNHFNEMVDEWIEKGKMTEEEGRKFVEDIMNKAKGVKSDLEKKIMDQGQSFYENIHVATTEQIEALEKRISALEKLHKEK